MRQITMNEFVERRAGPMDHKESSQTPAMKTIMVLKHMCEFSLMVTFDDHKFASSLLKAGDKPDEIALMLRDLADQIEKIT